MKIIYQEYSRTFRSLPTNYWLATVRDGKLVFDSWDGMTKKMYRKNPLLYLRIIILFYWMKIFGKIY